jgi:hypothetical protein
LLRVLARAFVLPWEQRKAILRAAIIPLLVVTALGWVGEYTPIRASLVDWAWLLVCSLATGWFAVCVHRCVLLDTAGAREGFTAASLLRVALYAISIAATWALFSGLMQSLMFIGTALLVDQSGAARAPLEAFIQDTRVSLASMFIAAAIVAVICGRLCLLLPALAVDADVRDALRAARGNTLRLTAVFSLLPAALALFGDLLLRDDSTLIETGLLVVLGAIFAIVEVVALSLSYRELTSPAPPPTDPPA